MRYESEIIVNKPVAESWAFMDNPDTMHKWQPGLVSTEAVSGELGQVGSKMKMNFDDNGRKIELVETILERGENFIHTSYDTSGVYNTIETRMSAVGEDQTKISMVSDFKFSGFFRFVAPLMRGSFKKQTQLNLTRLKDAIEQYA